jgi:cytochrome d ubiquinol oxidase subunit II
VPIDSNGDFDGGLVDLFTPYTVFAGLTFVVVFAFHGASYLTLRTTGDLYERVGLAARRLAIPAAAAAAAFLVWTVVVAIDRNDKDVFPVVVPAIVGIAALVLAAALAYAGRNGRAFAMTALGTVATVVTLFTGLYPRVMVSSTDFSNSLDVPGAASAHYTLVVLTVVALITLPVVLLYQGWSYYVFRARVRGEDVDLPAVASPTGGSPAG